MRVDLHTFERMYREEDDPWSFASSPYEQRKYELTVASLPRRYSRAFEPGSSIGALSEKLAPVADALVTLETSPTAAAAAARRLAHLPTVDVRCGAIPEDWPEGLFDLIVLSEIGYYWDSQTLAAIVSRVERSMMPGGHVIAVHWLGDSEDHLLNGADVHEIIGGALGRSTVHHAEPEFVLDLWTHDERSS